MIPLRIGGELRVVDTVPDFPQKSRKPTAAELASVVELTGQWPGVQGLQADGSVSAGPTGSPWVNANAALIRIEQFKNPGKQIWLNSAAPDGKPTPATLQLPFADAAQFGASWVASDFGDDGTKLRTVLSFFQKHREWYQWEPVGALGIVSNFRSGLEKEFLNLATRRTLCTRILDMARPQGLTGLKGIVWLDSKVPDNIAMSVFRNWAGSGNLLVLPFGTKLEGPSVEEHGHQVHTLAKGRIAVPLRPWSDPYTFVHQTHLLLSHRHDVMRLWNGGSLNPHYTASADGKRAVVQLVNYTAKNTSNVTLGLDKKIQTATLHTFDDVRELKFETARVGVEIPLPTVGVYAAIEFEI